VSLIQGPPGTGKTFLALQVVRVLLAARRAGDPPILFMCLTNHALDQFLEGVVAMGERNIVRVGAR
jgi:superfamily II DNA or RNA helicase